MATQRSRRAEDAALLAELQQRAERAQSAQAQTLIDAFVTRARAQGAAPVRLEAQLTNGSRAHTDVEGWTIRNDATIAIGTDGGYYVLGVPGDWLSALASRFGRPVHIEPSPPQLVVGRGGSDGVSHKLADLLEQRLRQG